VWCVGKIALFAKALVSALARGALAMCAMWVRFPSSFLWVGRKKQNKFPSNLHCPVIKLNSFYFQFITIVSVWSSVFTLVANVGARGVGHLSAITIQPGNR